ncbi:uncharacterized protein BKA55DRAFT_692693 [Fusarium redolens]|jgi:hypothetical protein|uniref:Uncharacterized protein n=1 Tax=Fusarium redolens TaxID=48865 RepID=A0A9P9K4A5_FUSRE|nr:uncharacterized protein BKA55DRAFT_692693 [Fusarium redolens]KAH7243525.1 hypothetical protein BKA55DRAFT_692693 [Fusarium redolens]
MPSLPSTLTLRNIPPLHHLQARGVDGNHISPHHSDYDLSESYASGDYGTGDDTGEDMYEHDWWSCPEKSAERIAVFSIVTGILFFIVVILCFKIRKLKKGLLM